MTRPLFAMAIPTKYVAMKALLLPKYSTRNLKVSQNRGRNTCGAEIKGMSTRVATGLAISLLRRPKTEFQGTASQAGGNVAVWAISWVPNFHQHQMAKPVSATGLKSSGIAKALTSVAPLMKIIADHTSK